MSSSVEKDPLGLEAYHNDDELMKYDAAHELKEELFTKFLEAWNAYQLAQDEVDFKLVAAKNAIDDCVDNGILQSKLADAVGVSRQRISQLYRLRPEPR